MGGLDAALAGSLAQLIETLLAWRASLAQSRTPAEWGEQARALLAAFFDAAEEGDRLTLAQLQEALQSWLETCDSAGFDEAVPLAVLREAWLGALDEPTLNHQFVSGGVTFCTLMPMRAVPFRVVCLLGMNDGDFPRRARQADFDLLALPGMARPGDRSRRDDDRYLMLEALLAARDKLYISWVGRNVRDNSEQPASVLVSQLRDYLAAGWELDLARDDHRARLAAVQPALFRAGRPADLRRRMARGARRRRDADGRRGAAAVRTGRRLPPETGRTGQFPAPAGALFLPAPARRLVRRRRPRWARTRSRSRSTRWSATCSRTACSTTAARRKRCDEVRASLAARAERLAREGVLPIGLVGQQVAGAAGRGLVPVRTAWLTLGARFQAPRPSWPVSLRLRRRASWTTGSTSCAAATTARRRG